MAGMVNITRACATVLLVLFFVANDAVSVELGTIKRIVASSSTYEFGREIAVGDVNGDGEMDLVLSSPSSYLVHIVPGGKVLNDFLTSELDDPWDIDKLIDLSVGTIIMDSAAGFGRSVAVGDVDGDGIDDITIMANTRAYLLYGSPSWPSVVSAATSGTLLHDPTYVVYLDGQVVVQDLDGDGKAEIILGRSSSSTYGAVVVSVHTKTSVIELAKLRVSYPLYSGYYVFSDVPTTLAVGDVNCDGYKDLLLGANGNVYAVYGAFTSDVYIGSGTSAVPGTLEFLGASITNLVLTSARFVNDVKCDSVSHSTDNLLSVYKGISCDAGATTTVAEYDRQLVLPAPVWRSNRVYRGEYEDLVLTSELDSVSSRCYVYYVEHGDAKDLEVSTIYESTDIGFGTSVAVATFGDKQYLVVASPLVVGGSGGTGAVYMAELKHKKSWLNWLSIVYIAATLVVLIVFVIAGVCCVKRRRRNKAIAAMQRPRLQDAQDQADAEAPPVPSHTAQTGPTPAQPVTGQPPKKKKGKKKTFDPSVRASGMTPIVVPSEPTEIAEIIICSIVFPVEERGLRAQLLSALLAEPLLPMVTNMSRVRYVANHIDSELQRGTLITVTVKMAFASFRNKLSKLNLGTAPSLTPIVSEERRAGASADTRRSLALGIQLQEMSHTGNVNVPPLAPPLDSLVPCDVDAYGRDTLPPPPAYATLDPLCYPLGMSAGPSSGAGVAADAEGAYATYMPDTTANCSSVDVDVYGRAPVNAYPTGQNMVVLPDDVSLAELGTVNLDDLFPAPVPRHQYQYAPPVAPLPAITTHSSTSSGTVSMSRDMSSQIHNNPQATSSTGDIDFSSNRRPRKGPRT